MEATVLIIDIEVARLAIEGGVGALRESDDTNFSKPNGQSRNLNIYGHDHGRIKTMAMPLVPFYPSVHQD